MAKTVNTDADRKRYATVIKENGVVSNVHRMEGGPPFLDKRAESFCEIVPVSDDVKIGMTRQPDGTFEYHVGHADRPRDIPERAQ